MLITISQNQNNVFELFPCPTNSPKPRDFSFIIINNKYTLKKLYKLFDFFAFKNDWNDKLIIKIVSDPFHFDRPTITDYSFK